MSKNMAFIKNRVESSKFTIYLLTFFFCYFYSCFFLSLFRLVTYAFCVKWAKRTSNDEKKIVSENAFPLHARRAYCQNVLWNCKTEQSILHFNIIRVVVVFFLSLSIVILSHMHTSSDEKTIHRSRSLIFQSMCVYIRFLDAFFFSVRFLEHLAGNFSMKIEWKQKQTE